MKQLRITSILKYRMKRIRQFIQRREFLKFFLIFFSGTLLAQVITFAVSPILTRLYTPEEFGAYGTYIAIVSLLIVFVTGRYEFAINTTEEEEDAVSVYRIVKYLSIFTSGVVLVFLFFFAPAIKNLLEFDFNEQLLYFIPITLLIMGFLQASLYYSNRKKDFQVLSKSKVIQSTANSGISISAGLLHLGVIGIISGHIVGILASYLYQTTKNVQIVEYKLSQEKLKRSLVRYKQYPLFNAPSAFFDNLAAQAPVIILIRFFSEATVGFYSLTTRVIGMPLGLISTSISQVFLSQISELHRNNKSYRAIVLKIAMYLAGLGLIPLLIAGFLGPQLFSIIFGSEWRIAGEYARILSIGYFFKFVVAPLSVIFFINQRIKLLSTIQISRAFSTVLLLVFSSTYFELKTVLIAYSIHEALFYVIYFYFILRTSK